MASIQIDKSEKLDTEIITNDLIHIDIIIDQTFNDDVNKVEIENKIEKGFCFPLCFIPEILTCLTCISLGGCGLIGLVGTAACGLITLVGGLLASLGAVLVPIIGLLMLKILICI
jgi:hypothetical protein